MFAFLKKKNSGKNKELNELIAEIQMNMENNYKDAAQQAYKQFCSRFMELQESRQLSKEQQNYYREQLERYEQQLTGYTHKEQKCGW